MYAISLSWPGERLVLRRICPRPDTQIRMLGVAEPLAWKFAEKQGLVIELPASLQSESNRPCRQAYAFKIDGEPVRSRP